MTTLTLIYHNPGQLVNNTGNDADAFCNILCSCNNPSSFDAVTSLLVNNSWNDVFDLLLHISNRDELNARLQAITAEHESNLNNVQFRFEVEQSQHVTEQQRLQYELEEAQRATKQIIFERDELLAKIEILSKVNRNCSIVDCAVAIEYIKMIACWSLVLVSCSADTTDLVLVSFKDNAVSPAQT